MPTARVNTEPTATTIIEETAESEQRASTPAIKLEQHTSDGDNTAMFESDADSEEDGEGETIYENDEDGAGDCDDDDDYDDDGDTDRHQAAEAPKNQQRFICEYIGCGRSYSHSHGLMMHQHEHKLQTELYILGDIYIVIRQSLNDRWPCPIPDCASTLKSAATICEHIRGYHSDTIGQQQQLQQPPINIARRKLYFLDMDDFDVNGVRCGYHTTTGVFICHECRLVPECLLIHLQQKHGYDEKAINSEFIPESARVTGSDPNINQHTSNPHLAAAIREPYQQQHPDIVPGWLCAASDCGYCSYADHNKPHHTKRFHQGKQLATVPALVLCLTSTNVFTSCVLITRIDQASGAVTTRSNRVSRYRPVYSYNGLSAQDETDSDISQNETEEASNQKKQWKCNYPDCGRLFSSSSQLSTHQHEHGLQAELYIYERTYTLTRQSLDGRWLCPFPDCTSTAKTTVGAGSHIRSCHGDTIKQQQHRQQQPLQQIARRNLYFLGVDDFYVNGALCGYHTTTGVFICHECGLVPECLLTHLQQKHGCDEESIDSSTLPESAVNANANTNINQHTRNSHLASAISQPYQQHHQDIFQGWLCVTSNCGCCGYSAKAKSGHKIKVHQEEQLTTVPALVLRLVYAKSHNSCYIITRIDQASGAVTTSSNRMDQYNGLNTRDENEEDTSQSMTTEASNQKQQWKCGYPNCEHVFNSPYQLTTHRREHQLESVIGVRGKDFTLSRQSSDDRWPCPITDCKTTFKTAGASRSHIRLTHRAWLKHNRANIEDNEEQQQQQNIKKIQRVQSYLNVDEFYVNGALCGYHTTTEVFICHECRLVPECLLIHLQQKHGYDEISIDKSVLPDSAVNANADPNINQRTRNSLLAAAIRQPYWRYHQDIVEGWLCVVPDCGYCGYTVDNKVRHKKNIHQGEQLATVPALVLRLLYGKVQASCFLITHIGQASGAVTVSSSNRMEQHNRSNTRDENGDDVDQNEITDASNLNRQWKCGYPNCGRVFSSSGQLSAHRHEHKLKAVIKVQKNIISLTRQSLADQWSCPIPGCEKMCNTVAATHCHILGSHRTWLKQKRANMEDDDNDQQHLVKRAKHTVYYLMVDDFYICGIRCGYHKTTGVFFCYGCKLVPECLLTHLQQKHGYDGKSIDNSVLPESAVNANANANSNQHTSNTHLAAAIGQPYQHHHQSIVHGWLCIAPNCGYCHSTYRARYHHHYMEHGNELQSTAPALLLRLLYGKAQTSCFLITRLNTITNTNINSRNSMGQYDNESENEEEVEIEINDNNDEDDIYAR